jgi:hypothetical protein
VAVRSARILLGMTGTLLVSDRFDDARCPEC